MNTEDKLYNKIKSAAEKGETPNFSSMDKVWNRVEDKLEAKISKNESSKWKKIAVAASLLVVGVLCYNWLQSPINNESIPENTVVVLDSIPTKIEEAVVSNELPETTPETIENQHPIIKKNAAEIIQSEIQNNTEVVADVEEIEIASDKIPNEAMTLSAKNNVDKMIQQSENYRIEMMTPVATTQNKKEQPLVIIDGKAKKNMKAEDIDAETIDSLVYLKEPLYIINGEEYTEQELFGENPTSPYAPLNKQNIISTTVYQGLDATKLYGKKGEKGVVIITTKDGKPSSD
ncbi:hypothetical protein [Flavobacterium sp.]|uniref:hypothetical protein n=1 Tax=Flavobacterium sp. TaxID=239 RepID=UPI003528142A